MTPVFCCGFECGVLPANGGHWNPTASAPSISTTTVRTGNRALRINPSASIIGASSSAVLATAVNVFRVAIRFTTLPAADMPLVTAAAGSNLAGAFFKQSDSKIYAGTKVSSVIVLGATGVAVTTGIWYIIDVKSDMTSNPWLIDVQVSGTACGQKSTATAGTTTAAFRLGDLDANQSADIFFDDAVWSQTTGDYPIGNGYVNHFVPTADGTHNVAGTGDFQRTLTGTDILNATTTAFQLVDEVPFEAIVTDWINMLAPVNATDYVECIFGPAPGIQIPIIGPRAVEVIAGINQAATGNGNMEIRLNDNGSMGTVYTATGIAGVAVASGQVFKRAHFADPPSAASTWNALSSGNGAFNNVRVRFGSPAALDVNPDQYFGCIMIEAEFADQLDAAAFGRPAGQLGQQQMAQLLAQ